MFYFCVSANFTTQASILWCLNFTRIPSDSQITKAQGWQKTVISTEIFLYFLLWKIQYFEVVWLFKMSNTTDNRIAKYNLHSCIFGHSQNDNCCFFTSPSDFSVISSSSITLLIFDTALLCNVLTSLCWDQNEWTKVLLWITTRPIGSIVGIIYPSGSLFVTLPKWKWRLMMAVSLCQ